MGAVGKQGFWRRGVLGKGLGTAENGEGLRGGENFQDREPFCGGLGIGDFVEIVFRIHRGIREHQRANAPEFEFCREAFALAWGFVDDPVTVLFEVFGGGAGESCKEGMGGLLGMVEHDGISALGQKGQTLGEFRGVKCLPKPGAGVRFQILEKQASRKGRNEKLQPKGFRIFRSGLC